MKKLIFAAIMLVSQSIIVSAPSAQVIFEDDFESGKAGPNWTDFAYVTVVSLPSETGRTGYGMKFRFVGNADDKADATAEARFDLKAEYKDLSIQFDLFIPKNYVHSKPSDNADNNKFFRLWRVNYGVGDQVGASLVSQLGGSGIGADYKQQPTWSVSTALFAYKNFIGKDDLGKWMTIKINAIAPRDDLYRGVIQIWKNGQSIVRTDAVADSEPGEQGWRYGYLLGWANSGFREDTDLYIDNVKMYVEQGRPDKVPALIK